MRTDSLHETLVAGRASGLFSNLADELRWISEQNERCSGRYHWSSYGFVFGSFHWLQQCYPQPHFLSAPEVAEACRFFALEQFGRSARSVLAQWGVTTTEDLGRIIYALIDAG